MRIFPRILPAVAMSWFLPLLMMGSLFPLQNAGASLGGSSESVEKDRSSLNGTNGANGTVKVTAQGLYSVHEITAGKTTLREFTRQDGTVFAVGWHGPVRPDLSVILGEYFDEYQIARAALSGARKRGPRVTRSERAVVEEGGHMRNLSGMAYVPGLVPTGVNIAEVR